MIQVEAIATEHFRGIKQLTLALGRENFGVCGPNGCGKSGIVDAIEFALTGSITRLTGEGTGGLSVRTHGPHVDVKDTPELAVVCLGIFLPRLNRSATIERRVNNPRAAKIEPQDEEVGIELKKTAAHPEFALSRREILKYILTEPGKRSREVQALLRLDAVEKVRTNLQAISNSCKSELRSRETEVTVARNRLLSALGITELKNELLLAAVNDQRKELSLTAITSLEKDTALKTGVTESRAEKKRAINKGQAIADLERLYKLLNTEDLPDVKKSIDDIISTLAKLVAEPTLLSNLKRQAFLKTGYDLIEGDLCPFCEREWDIAELKQLISRRLAEAKEAESLKKRFDNSSLPLASSIRELVECLKSTVAYAKAIDPPIDASAIESLQKAVEEFFTGLTSLERIPDLLGTLSRGWKSVSEEVQSNIEKLSARFQALPDSSKEDKAKEFLILADERLDVYRAAKRQQEVWKKRCDNLDIATSAYAESSEAVLSAIYIEVEKDFSRYYQFINREDESTFQGKLKAGTGKLDFEVDFYGRGYFPPGAYHSEGHQDGMGLCLYLALMKHILGKGFTFAVLDDVLMSVDSGHRKEVCRLLKSEFPDTQFIITTHDNIWLQHMIAESVLTNKSVVRFRKWSVEDGPSVWNQQEVWAEIQTDLDKDYVPGASHALRRFLEYVSFELSCRLRASVEMRGAANYDLGDLLPAVVGSWGSLLAKAKDAARSWEQTEKFESINRQHENFKEKLAKSNVEQWAINKTVHYNEWANFDKRDFTPVVGAFKDLVDCFKCPTCGVFFYIAPAKGPKETIRCDCGATSINLKKRS